MNAISFQQGKLEVRFRLYFCAHVKIYLKKSRCEYNCFVCVSAFTLTNMLCASIKHTHTHTIFIKSIKKTNDKLAFFEGKILTFYSISAIPTVRCRKYSKNCCFPKNNLNKILLRQGRTKSKQKISFTSGVTVN